MKIKYWILAGALFAASVSVWAGYMASRRAFLRDFNDGVHAYLAGDFSAAETSLRHALDRRPRNDEVKQLLLKAVIERSFAQYHQKDFKGALETLARAPLAASQDPGTAQALATLRLQLATPQDQRPVNMEQVLDGMYRHLPEKNQPESLQSLMELYFHRTQVSQEVILKKFSDNQEAWLARLEHEKEEFRKILYGGLLLFGIAGFGLLVLFIGVLRTYLGRKGIFAQLLEQHYQRLVAALPAGSHVMLGPPMSLHHIPEAQQMDIIEAEIVSGQNTEDSVRRLQPLLEVENPWVRARAAKILYPLNPTLSLEELKRLVADAASGAQVSGMWALAELGTAEAIDVLAPLAYSPAREIQQGTIRSLLQLQSRSHLSPDVRKKLDQLMTEIRSRTGWVF
jgi:hypothetical protein